MADILKCYGISFHVKKSLYLSMKGCPIPEDIAATIVNSALGIPVGIHR